MTPKNYTKEDLKPTGETYTSVAAMEAALNLRMAGEVFRETANYVVTFTPTKAGKPRYRIRAKNANARPRQRTVGPKDWVYLSDLKDESFDFGVCWEIGVGTHQA